NLAHSAVRAQVEKRALDWGALAFQHCPDLDEHPIAITRRVGVQANNAFAAKFGINRHDGFSVSVQGLVLAEIGNRESQRVDLDEVIAYRVAEGKDEMGDELGTLDLAAIERRLVNQFIFDGGLVGCGAQVLDVDAVDLDFLVRSRTRKEVIDDFVPGPAGERAVGKLGVHEQQSAAEVIADGELVAAVVQAAEFREEILDLFFLRLVVEVVVVNGLGPANRIDTDIARVKRVDLLDRRVSDVDRPGAQQAER